MPEFIEEEWNELKNKDFDLIVTEEERDKILKEIGYSVDEEGFLIDNKTKQRVKAEDGKEININKDKKFALVAGTHTFVRNIAGYSDYLAKKGQLPKIEAED